MRWRRDHSAARHSTRLTRLWDARPRITVGYRDGSPPPAQEWVRRRAATSLAPSGWLSARRVQRLLVSLSFVVLFCCYVYYMLFAAARQCGAARRTERR